MKILLSLLFLVACVASLADESRHGGTRSMGKVGEFEWVQAEEVALPDLDLDGGPNSGKAGQGGPDSRSYRKEHPEVANVFLNSPSINLPGAKPGASTGGGQNAGGNEDANQADPNKLMWKESSTALVDGKAQLVQFGYDANGNIQGVKFADRDQPVMTSVDRNVPEKLRTAGGGIDLSIGGRKVASINATTPKCAG